MKHTSPKIRIQPICFRSVTRHVTILRIARLMSDMSRKEPYKASAYKVSMANSKRYICGCNLFWASMDDPVTANVPLNPKQIQQLEAHYFQTPAPMPLVVKIAVVNGEDPLKKKGMLFRISPVEIIAAMVSAVANAIRAGASVDLLHGWRTQLLTVPFEFVECEGDDPRHFMALQYRENLVANYAGMRYSTIMKIFDLESFMDRKARTTGRLTSAACAAMYRESLTLSAASEEITDSFVDMALTISQRLLSHQSIRQALIEADQEFSTRNPLDSTTKLQTIINKAGKDTAKLEWCVLLLLDLHASGALRYDQIGLRALQGGGTKNGGKGLLDLLLFKRELLQYMVNGFCDALKFPPAIKVKIRETCTSISQYRASCGYSYNPAYKPVKKSFMAGWPKSAELFMCLLDGLVFGYEYDDALRAGLRNRKDPETVLESDSIADEVSALRDCLDKESGVEAEAKGGADEDDQGTIVEEASGAAAGIEHLVSLSKVARSVNEDRKQKLEKFKLSAKNLVSSNLDIAPETLSQGELVRRLKDSAAGQFRGDPDQHTHRAIFYDPKVTGQCSSMPHLRTPPLRGNGDHVKGLVKVMLDTTDGEIATNDVYFFMDGGRAGNHDKLLGGFTTVDGAPMPKKKHNMMVLYEEESCQNHQERVRGFCSIQQTEGLLVVSNDVLSLNEHKRLHSGGTNRGNVVGPLAWPSFEQSWRHTKETKKTIFGKNGVILVGGPCPGLEGADAGHVSKVSASRKSSLLEPVFFHAPPGSLYAESIHGFDAGAGVILALGDGAGALEFLRRRKPCFGVVLTEEHGVRLTMYLEARVFEDMQDERSPLYSAQLVEIMTQKDGMSEEDPDQDDEEPGAGKPAPKRAGKRKATGADGAGSAGAKPKAKKGARKATKDFFYSMLTCTSFALRCFLVCSFFIFLVHTNTEISSAISEEELLAQIAAMRGESGGAGETKNTGEKDDEEFEVDDESDSKSDKE